MPYIKYYETVTNLRGDVLSNYRVKVADGSGAEVPIYADRSGTRFTDSAGNLVNYAVAGVNGKAEFYWTPETGHVLQVLDIGGDLVDSTLDFADKYVLENLPGEIGQDAVAGLTDELAGKNWAADLASPVASTAAGLAATSDGQGFAVDNGDGTVTIYLNDNGVAVEQRTLATSAALASTDAGKGRDLIGEPTVAQLMASPVGPRGMGTVWHAGGYRYQEAASGATDHDETTAGGVKLYVQPTNGAYETNAFSGGIGARFNKAVAASKRVQTIANETFWPDSFPIRINPGEYTLDETLMIDELPNATVFAEGAVIQAFSGATTPLWMVASRKVVLHGLTIDMRNNTEADQAVMVAGQCPWGTMCEVKVQANTTNPDFAAFRFKQGSVAGFDDDNRDRGNFWFTLDRCWTRKFTSGDTGAIPVSVDLQGCQNAFRAVNCSFSNFGSGILIRNQNGSTLSNLSNDVQILHSSFEAYSGAAIHFTSTDSGDGIAGGAAIGNRFESGGSCFESDLTTSPSQPFQIFGSTVISSVASYTVDARSQKDQFSSLDTSNTPNYVDPRHIGARGIFFAATSNSYASVRARSKPLASGASFALERDDGVIDGRLSQRPGGGLDIDGGATGRVRLVGMKGLSGSATHSTNFSGVASLPSATAFVNVTIGAEADASFAVAVDVPYDTTVWVSNKTTTGFRINVGTTSPSSQSLRWMLWR